MNAREAGELLVVAQSVDGREVNETTMRSWAAILDDVPLADALAATKAHYREYSGVGLSKLMPAVVLEGARVIQHKRVVDAYGNTMLEALEAGHSRDEARKLAASARDQALGFNPLAVEAGPDA